MYRFLHKYMRPGLAGILTVAWYLLLIFYYYFIPSGQFRYVNW